MATRKIAGYKDDNKRRDVRPNVKGLKFIVGKAEYTVSDLSVGGFLLRKAVGKMRPGQKFFVSHVVTDQDGRVPLAAPAEVARVDYADTSLGCRFGKLTEGQFRIIEAIAMRRPITSLDSKPKKKGFFGLFGG